MFANILEKITVVESTTQDRKYAVITPPKIVNTRTIGLTTDILKRPSKCMSTQKPFSLEKEKKEFVALDPRCCP